MVLPGGAVLNVGEKGKGECKAGELQHGNTMRSDWAGCYGHFVSKAQAGSFKRSTSSNDLLRMIFLGRGGSMTRDLSRWINCPLETYMATIPQIIILQLIAPLPNLTIKGYETADTRPLPYSTMASLSRTSARGSSTSRHFEHIVAVRS